MNIVKQCYSNQYVVKSFFTTPGGIKELKTGFGFVLEGEYLATCYHMIYSNNQDEIFSHVVIYADPQNKADENGDQVVTKIKCFKEFSTECDQYDFSKHVYDRKNPSTDFVILKLEQPYKLIDHKFSSKTPSYGDAVYTLGYTSNSNNEKYLSIIFDQGKCLFIANRGGKHFIYYLGKAVRGFSGGLLYNSSGLACGMIQSGMGQYPSEFVDALLKEKLINQNLFNEIKSAYNTGHHLIVAMGIKSIENEYLKDYFPKCKE